LFLLVKDIPMKNQKQQIDLKMMFISTLKNDYFKKFMFFFVIWNFGLSIAGPYFNMYMIKNLKMSYFDIILLTQIVSNIVTIITLPYIGRVVDKIGNRPMLLFAASLLSLLPVVWCFTNENNYKYLVTLISIFAGMLWPIIDMSNNNLILKLSDQTQTSMYVGVINMFNAIFGTAIPIILGGYLIEDIAPHVVAFAKNYMHLNIATYHVAFFLSGFLRFLAVIYLKKNVKEPGAMSLKSVIKSKIKRV